MKVKCEVCNKEFNASRSTRKYCDRCASTVKKQKDLCNSKRIQQKHQMHYTKKCKNCGKEFETTSKIKVFCSKECLKENGNNLSLLRYQKNGKHVKQLYIKQCAICNEVFETTNNRRKYCSELCQKKLAMNKVKKDKNF